MGFRLCEGVQINGYEECRSCFERTSKWVSGLLSAELIQLCADKILDCIDEPMFFFLELPRENAEDEFDTWYLECTRKVARAVLDCYGELLVNDGVSRFGFGSHSTGEEVCFREYQEFTVYCPDGSQRYADVLESLNVHECEQADSLWSLMSDENNGILTPVEAEGLTVFDIPELLAGAGMYKYEE